MKRVISWINASGNGHKAFWGATGLVCLPILFLPNNSDEQITQKILLFLSSPMITMLAFSAVWAIWILWTEVLFPIAKYIKKKINRWFQALWLCNDEKSIAISTIELPQKTSRFIPRKKYATSALSAWAMTFISPLWPSRMALRLGFTCAPPATFAWSTAGALRPPK